MLFGKISLSLYYLSRHYRGPGLIDLRFLLQAANAASILQQSQAWTEQDHSALVQWFNDLSAWYTTSEQGKHVIRMKK